MSTEQDIRESVKEYYGRILKDKHDLKTTVCCALEAPPRYLQGLLHEIHPEILEKFYGCGFPVPPDLQGRIAVDLGSGTGRDCYLLSKLVGTEGTVIGVDMLEEQLAVARRHLDFQMGKWGFPRENVQFRQGYIEDLASAGITDNSVDVVVSNCVLNLSPNKPQVFSEIFRVLKPGGELYFSDIFCNRRIPQCLAEDPLLLGECLGGVLYLEDFRRILATVGCLDYQVLSSRKLGITSAEIEERIGKMEYYSMLVRCFKLDLEDRPEDYGQTASYLGTMPEFPTFFPLDKDQGFERARVVPISGNAAKILQKSRYNRHFRVEGDNSVHFGRFRWSTTTEASSADTCCR
jgi:arsenite methyltransferase